jgi:SAM-dependent methyltransferase
MRIDTDPLPWSEACERNRHPILDALRGAFDDRRRVLEIGAGTGQHAVHFARALPHLSWQPTDREEWLPALAARIAREGPANIEPPFALDVACTPWPPVSADAVFSANTLHIMAWREIEAFVAGLGGVLPAGGVLAIYGPFRYGGAYTSESNARFDAALRERDPASGVRDAEAVDELAAAVGLELTADLTMPANNQLRLWQRR